MRRRLDSRLTASLLRALARLTPRRVLGAERLEAARRSGRPLLFALWHGRVLLPIAHHRDQGIVVLASLSRDGEYAAQVLERMGYRCVRGSSSKGGSPAALALLAALREGGEAVVVPDGPRGPARTLKPGLLHLAAAARALVVPVSAAARPAWRLRSWDGMAVPLPGAQGVVAYGAPLDPPARLAPAVEERLRLELEASLIALDREADAAVGAAPAPDRPRLAPAAPAAPPPDPARAAHQPLAARLAPHPGSAGEPGRMGR